MLDLRRQATRFVYFFNCLKNKRVPEERNRNYANLPLVVNILYRKYNNFSNGFMYKFCIRKQGETVQYHL